MPMNEIRIAVAFDFDETLGPDSTSAYLDAMGVDVPEFWNARVKPRMDAGWNHVLAWMYEMVVESSSRPAGRKFTRASMVEFGKSLAIYPGVRRMFADVTETATIAAAAAPNTSATVEYFLVSSGLQPIFDSCPIRAAFRDVWASDFFFDEDDAVVFPSNAVTFTEKTRYLFQIAKGLFGPGSRGTPFEVNRKVPPERQYVPMGRMVFVGDGYTDIPCFSLLQKNQGYAIGVFSDADRSKWGISWGFVEEGRVSNLVPADFTKKGGARAVLRLAVSGIVGKAITYGG